jgi:hypothetical protein
MNTLALALLPLLAASAQDDFWKGLSLGDRVQVTFRSGNSLTGTLTFVSADPKAKVDALDYAKETAVSLDLSWEYPGLNGTMTIPKREIKEIRKLEKLDAAALKALQEQKKKIEKDLELQNRKNREESDRREKEALEAAKQVAEREAMKAKLSGQAGDVTQKLERMKKGLELLAKFPPPAWGKEKLSEIARKAQLKIPVSQQENEFVQNYDFWVEARNAQEEGKKKPEGGGTVEPKPAPNP